MPMPTLSRRTLIAGAAALTLTGLPRAATAQAVALPDISNYLNALRTAQADFTQVNPDGTISTGRLSILRPGRMRFEYAPPDEALVIAGGGQVAIFDPKSNQPPEQYPLRRTPLNLILGANVDLTRDRMVVAHGQDGPVTYVVAQDPENPQYGNLRLIFTAGPVALRQWVVTDDAGQQTTVVLGDLRTGMDLPANLFDALGEAERRGF
jgi:outer membrane lipoprotein-sorting protein